MINVISKDISMLEKAIIGATMLHMGQLDKAEKPYILHPMRVMMSLWKEGQSEEVLCAALLHDVIEDCGSTRETLLEMGFHMSVVDMVDLVSRRKDQSYTDYVSRIKESGNKGAISIKLADLNDNMSPIRMSALPASAQTSLMKRYTRAVDTLVRP